MARIRKTKTGLYQAVVYIGRDANGKQIRKTLSHEKEGILKSMIRQLEMDVENKNITEISNMRLSDWLDKWLELNESRLAVSTYASYKMFSNKHFKPYFKNVKLNQITELQIKDYINLKLKTLSSTTVRKHMLFLKMVLNDGLKGKNPCLDITLPKNAKYVPVIPTDEQFEYILSTYKHLKQRLIVSVAGKCGLRLGEIFALRWDDIDFKNKNIKVDESISRDVDNKYVFKDPKSDNGFRTIPCPDAILNMFKEYKDKHKGKVLSINHNKERIFTTRPDNFSTNFGQKMDRLGMGEIRFHDLRHYCASWMYINGVPDQVVAELLGHDIVVLKSIYQHIQVDKRAKIMDTIRALQNDQKCTKNDHTRKSTLKKSKARLKNCTFRTFITK